MTKLTRGRLDIKCGNGAISKGEKCTKTTTPSLTRAAQIGGGLAAVGLAGALLHNKSRKALLQAPKNTQRALQRVVTNTTHHLTGQKPTMRFKGEAFKKLSKTQRLSNAARKANIEAEQAISRAFNAEKTRAIAVGEAMYKTGKATGISIRSEGRKLRLRVEKARRKYEPGYRKNTTDAAEGKKYSKTVTNPKTGRKNKISYGAKGYTIAPGTSKGDRYCARSFGDMKSHSKDCSGADRNTPLCLSRAKWKCSGKTSRRDSVWASGFEPNYF